MGIAHRPLATAALASGLALLTVPARAQSVTLFPAQLSEANIDALFGQPTPVPAETTTIPLPGINGNAVLHSRVIRAACGSRAQGRFAYAYRAALRDAPTFAAISCVTNLWVKVGPIEHWAI